MIKIRKSNERGFFDHGWLQTHHTFSFGQYHDEKFMGYHALRVINEDIVAPNEGFPTHSHRNMEILTCVLEGQLTHEDSMGNKEVIHEGEIQWMCAGKAVAHSEYNRSSKPVHLYQIWIEPAQKGLTPGYHQIQMLKKTGQWICLASPEGRDGSYRIHQQVEVSVADVEKGKQIGLAVKKHGWLQLLKGSITVDGISLNAGDGGSIEGPVNLELKATALSKVLFFDFAK
jgi:quercetin 2,3-dioxygenase